MRATEILRVAYRASPPGDARHCVRAELVHLLRGHPRVAVHPRLDRGDDVDRSGDLLRPARHRSVRSHRPGRAADVGAMGRQHHRGAGRSRQSRSCPPRYRRRFRRRRRYSPRRTPPVRRRWSAASAMRIRFDAATPDPEKRREAMVGHVGNGRDSTCLNPDMPWNEEIRAAWARMERLAASPATVALMLALVSEMDVRARASHSPRADASSSNTPTMR